MCKPPMFPEADANCQANVVAIDAGSYDSDTPIDQLNIVQNPQVLFLLGLGETSVTLTVTDGTLSSSCTTKVTVENDAPLIESLKDRAVFAGGSLQLSVIATDIQFLTYTWNPQYCPGATIEHGDSATPTLSIAAGTSPGSFCEVSVEVCDACGDCSWDACTVSFRVQY